MITSLICLIGGLEYIIIIVIIITIIFIIYIMIIIITGLLYSTTSW